VIALHADMQYPDVTVGNAAKEIIEDLEDNGKSIDQIVKDVNPVPTPAAEDTALQALGIGWDAAEEPTEPVVETPKDNAAKAPPLVLSIDEYEPDPNLFGDK